MDSASTNPLGDRRRELDQLGEHVEQEVPRNQEEHRGQAEVVAERAGTVANAWAQLNEQCFRRLMPTDQVHVRDVRTSATQQVVELQAVLQL